VPAVSFSAEGGIGTILLDKPPANSYDLEYVQELGAAVEEAATDDDVKVVLLRSASEKFFCAGADIKAFQAGPHERNMEMIETSHRTLSSIAGIPKIFVAELNGHALGGGLEIPLACDLRFAADGDYRLGTPEATLGLLPGNGGTQRLPRLIGRSRALDLMITGRRVSAQEGAHLGFVQRVVPVDELDATVDALAAELAGKSPLIMRWGRDSFYRVLEMDADAALSYLQGMLTVTTQTEDAAEGVAAFAEKRTPVWKGR